jgi:hypothetical protein
MLGGRAVSEASAGSLLASRRAMNAEQCIVFLGNVFAHCQADFGSEILYSTLLVCEPKNVH